MIDCYPLLSISYISDLEVRLLQGRRYRRKIAPLPRTLLSPSKCILPLEYIGAKGALELGQSGKWLPVSKVKVSVQVKELEGTRHVQPRVTIPPEKLRTTRNRERHTRRKCVHGIESKAHLYRGAQSGKTGTVASCGVQLTCRKHTASLLHLYITGQYGPKCA